MMLTGKQIDDIVRRLCTTMMNPDDVTHVNKKIIGMVQHLHDKWTKNGNLMALIEASYLIDFYCSKVVNNCDVIGYHNGPTIDPSHQTARKFVWDGFNDTHDVFKTNLSYAKGLALVKRTLFNMRKEFMKNMMIFYHDLVAPYLGSKYVMIPLDWKTMLKTHNVGFFLRVAEKTIRDFTVYNASGWGMYRLVNLNTFSDKLPASCIVNSLLTLSLLYLCGFPHKSLQSYFQAPPTGKHKKYTHWASTCHDPFDHTKKSTSCTINTFVEKDVRPFSSSEAFASYTRDIINYYDIAVGTFIYSPNHPTPVSKVQRRQVLANLKQWYDYTFASVYQRIKTPSSSRSSKTKTKS